MKIRTGILSALFALSALGMAAAAPSPSPAPAASATPVPLTITPPPAPWTRHDMPMQFGGFQSDAMWIIPGQMGAVIAGHSPSGGVTDLNAFASALKQGLTQAAGPDGVTVFKPVKVCAGKQDAYYAEVHLTMGAQKIVEKITMALSNQAYLAEYVRPEGGKDDAAAIAAINTLCAP